MKTRLGFVSNSSSSSFIISLPKKPKSVEELKSMMYPYDKEISYEFYDDKSLTTEQAAGLIFDQISVTKPLTKKQFIEELYHGSVMGEPKYDHYNVGEDIRKEYEDVTGLNWYEDDESLTKAQLKVKKQYDIKYWKKIDESNKEYRKVKDAWSEEQYNIFMGNAKNKLFMVEFSDNGEGEEGVIMEHGNAFDEVKHIVISNH